MPDKTSSKLRQYIGRLAKRPFSIMYSVFKIAANAVQVKKSSLANKKFLRTLRDKPELLELHNSLNQSFRKYSKEFGRGALYQGLKSIHVAGQRPTEKRFEIYGLKKYLKKNFRVLDIGSNCGFFSLYVSQFVDSVDGIEKDPYMVEIANKAKNYLKITNCSFHKSIFEDFRPKRKYDCILSFAVHRRVKYSLDDYLKELDKLLNKNGFLVMESHNIGKEDRNFSSDVKSALGKRYAVKRSGRLKDDRIIEREFLVMMKK